MIPGSRPVLVCHTDAEHDWEPLATVHGPVARLCNRCGAYEMDDDAKSAEPPVPSLEELAASAVKRCRECGAPRQDSDECDASGMCLTCLNGGPPGPPAVPVPDAHRPVG